MKYASRIIAALWIAAAGAHAQPQFSLPHGLYDQASLTVSISATDPEAEVRYTTDGTEPTPQSRLYAAPLTLTGTTLLRAVEVKGGANTSAITTATYVFTSSVLTQPNNPAGYPATWGAYTEIRGTATADYEMDPEMTGDPVLGPKIVQGLGELPILSIVTDKDNLFSHENDPDRGGIYIFTGPPVGDGTGHGWTRPVSAELMGGPQAHDLTVSCGLRLHGGHGRLAEKNPKHSMRLVFKKEYGAGKLDYPVFGSDAPATFDQLVLRCHFGNSWQHWNDPGRTKAQYTRDVWARRMQRRLGWPAVDALYVHLFLNGMYWGIYNIAERVDDQYGKNHFGGKKSDYDVLKIEESGGNHIEASEGDMEAWNDMLAIAARAADDAAYYRLQGLNEQGEDDPELEPLLNVDAFIDYMLINQYGGNTDWDHHNWYALRRRGADSEGFYFLCWDTEQIFEGLGDNVVEVNNKGGYPTNIFNNLLQNGHFARRYLHRAKELLTDGGMLSQAPVVAMWDSLYHTISTALYAEAARWGDYRRDVHRYASPGQLYTVDGHYAAERNRLLTQYFPDRSARVLSAIERYVDIDDWEMPDGWTLMAQSMFREWDGTDATAQPTDSPVYADWNLNTPVGSGGAVMGFVSVDCHLYADLTPYDKLVLRGTGSGLRILANRAQGNGAYKIVVVSFNSRDPYWDAELGGIALPLADLMNAPTNEGWPRQDDYLHLNAVKVDWGSASITVRGAYLIPSASMGIESLASDRSAGHDRYYNLNGQQVDRPTRGLYIRNGKKVLYR